jgi:hypothetical protein
LIAKLLVESLVRFLNPIHRMDHRRSEAGCGTVGTRERYDNRFILIE